MGLIELKEKNFSKAIDYFKDSISLLPYGPLTKRADFIDSLALVYYKTGDLDKAREEYERITSLTTGRLNYGDIYAKSFYMLGKIYEEQGDKAKAIEHYEKFLSLWKDADPGIAEVDDARERRAELKSQKIQ
jgi:tetratricopeptide (TPR) repeat protein